MANISLFLQGACEVQKDVFLFLSFTWSHCFLIPLLARLATIWTLSNCWSLRSQRHGCCRWWGGEDGLYYARINSHALLLSFKVINTILTLARHSNKKPSPCPSPLSFASLDEYRYEKTSLDQESVDQRPPTMDSGYSTLAQRRQHRDYKKRPLFHSQQYQTSHQGHQDTDIQHVDHIMQGERVKNNGSIYPLLTVSTPRLERTRTRAHINNHRQHRSHEVLKQRKSTESIVDNKHNNKEQIQITMKNECSNTISCYVSFFLCRFW